MIQALLFDFGGVVIDVNFNRAFECWQPLSPLSVEEMRATFKVDAAYQQHERGEITAAEYFAHLCRNLQLQEDHTRIAEGWNAIHVGEIVETSRMLQAAGTTFPCYAFTNTNATHQEAWTAMFPSLVQSFERIFVSSEMGRRKPEREAFEYVAREIGVTTDSIMFFDDLLENIEAASALGFQTTHVRSPADVGAALQKLGCLPW